MHWCFVADERLPAQAVVDHLATIPSGLGQARGAAAAQPPAAAKRSLSGLSRPLSRSFTVLSHHSAAANVSPKMLKAAVERSVAAAALAGEAEGKPTLVMGRVSGDIGVPVHTRTPGDLWVLGAGLTGGVGGSAAAAPSLSSSRDKPLFSPSTPRLLQEAKQLDVVKVQHYALISLAMCWHSTCECRYERRSRPGCSTAP